MVSKKSSESFSNMDNCIKNIIFCMDLMNYVAKLDKRDVKLGENLKRLVKESPFQDVIGKAVLIYSYEHLKNTSYDKDIERLKGASLKEVSQWAMSQSLNTMELERGFRPEQFISYCAKVCCSLPHIFSLEYCDRALFEVLANAICNRLDGFTLMGEFKEESWEYLLETAKLIVEQRKSKDKC